MCYFVALCVWRVLEKSNKVEFLKWQPLMCTQYKTETQNQNLQHKVIAVYFAPPIHPRKLAVD